MKIAKMFSTSQGIVQVLMLTLFVTSAVAAPVISAISRQGSVVAIGGSGFGKKTSPVPLVFANFSTDTVGRVPAGWASLTASKTLVTDTPSRSGAKSIDSSAINKTSDYFSRITYDLGSTIPLNGYVYLTAWMYLDQTGTTATGWNWKGPMLTSSPTTSTGAPPYWELTGKNTANTAIGFAGFYNNVTPRWFNTAGTIQYSANNVAVYNACASGNSWASDSFAFGGWQRVEWIIKTSSVAGAADGAITVNRIGKAAASLAATGCITYGNTSDHWRYLSLPQGFTNIAGGALNLKMIFSDIYVDNTLARVELCDSPTWAARTHCEIQPTVEWAQESIKIAPNGGTFTQGETAYIYVLSPSGEVNSNGHKFTVGNYPPLKNLMIAPGTTPQL